MAPSPTRLPSGRQSRAPAGGRGPRRSVRGGGGTSGRGRSGPGGRSQRPTGGRSAAGSSSNPNSTGSSSTLNSRNSSEIGLGGGSRGGGGANGPPRRGRRHGSSSRGGAGRGGSSGSGSRRAAAGRGGRSGGMSTRGSNGANDGVGRGPSHAPSHRMSNQSSRYAVRPSTRTNASTLITTETNLRDPGRLFAMLETALPKDKAVQAQDANGRLTHLEELRRAERLARTYDAVREWLMTNTNDPTFRREAATYLGTFGMTPLHVLCKLSDPPVDIVADVLDCAPETVRWAESSGWLPLHLAVASGAGYAVLALLCASDPEGKVAQDRRLRTPLHFAFFRDDIRQDWKGKSRAGTGALEVAADDRGYDSDWDDLDGGNGDDADIVDLLSDTGAAVQQDENGMLPLHYACAYGTSTGVLDVLLHAYPDSIVAKEKKGRTPLHLAMVNAARPASPAVIRFLLSIPDTNAANLIDSEGNLPLHLLANIAKRFRPDQKEEHTYATESLKIYLAASPKASSEFLTAVQRLPDWLQDHAVVSPHVQSILNIKIAKRFPTMLLLLDGYVLIMLIVCFEIYSLYTIDIRFQPDQPPEPARGPGFAYAIMAGGGYFFIRELIQAFALVNMGSFKSWIFSPGNWLDLFMMALVLTMGAAMIDENIMSKEQFRDLAALTKGILWVSFILYVKSTIVDFAVFVGGVQYVLRRLAAFIIALACILIAFAFMFYYVFSQTEECVPIVENGTKIYGNPHCTITNSLLRVYSMMMGEVRDTLYQTTVSQVLYLFYGFLVIILLSNVLIAIVTDSYGIVKNERAAMVFWSNRLNYIAEIDAIAAVRKKLFGEGYLIPRPYTTPDPESDDFQGMSKSKKVFRDLWKTLTGLFEANPYEYMDVSPGSFDFWCYLLLRLVAIFIIPAWLLLGLATAGWLWPPQVRERLLCQTAVQISRADIAEKAKKELNKLRHELRNLKREVFLEKRIDKKELSNVKAEVENLQRDVMSDLVQVKEVMKTLLDLEREKSSRR